MDGNSPERDKVMRGKEKEPGQTTGVTLGGKSSEQKDEMREGFLQNCRKLQFDKVSE